MAEHHTTITPLSIWEVHKIKTKRIAEIGENQSGRWEIVKATVREAAAKGAMYGEFLAYMAE